MEQKFTNHNFEKINEKALDAFIKDLNQYDRDHSMGTWLGRAMAGNAMAVTGSDLEKLQKKIKENLTVDDLESRHNPVLNKLGLNLESPNKEGNIDENETFATGSIKINLEDKRRYLSFLKSLDKEKITDSQKKILEMTVEKIGEQVQNEYKLEKADERLLELFSGMREIISEYERLGMGEKVTNFKDYLEYANSGYLREYILAKNKEIFRPIGEGFALSTFQGDSTYEHYIDYWNDRFFHVLEDISKNENAKEFYNKVLKYGKDCIAYAENDPVLIEREKNGSLSALGVRKAINEIKEKFIKINEKE